MKTPSDTEKGKRRAQTGFVPISFGKVSLEHARNAAEICGLSLTDFVRLSVSHSLANLYGTAFAAATARALRLFKTKVNGAVNRKFELLDFGEESVQQKLSNVNLTEAGRTSPKLRHNEVVISPLIGYPGLDQKSYEPAVSAVDNFWYEDLLKEITYPNPGMSPRTWMMALHATFLHAVGANNVISKGEKQRAKTIAKEAIQRYIEIEFYALKIRYQAIPGMRSEVFKLAVPPPELRKKIWNAPVLLHQYLTWCRFPNNTARPYDEIAVRFWPTDLRPEAYQPFIFASNNPS